MVNARCIAVAFLSYSTCGRAFLLRPRVASAHVINKPHGFVGLKQCPTRSRRALGTRTTAVVASAAEVEGDESMRRVRSTEDTLNPPGEVGAVKPWDLLPAGVAAAVAGVAIGGGLLHPELAHAADYFGECRVVLFWSSCAKSVFAVLLVVVLPCCRVHLWMHSVLRCTYQYILCNNGEERGCSSHSQPLHPWGSTT